MSGPQTDAEKLQAWMDAERNLSQAYLRLRQMIPGAFKTPPAPTSDQVWETTENALRELLINNEAWRSGTFRAKPRDDMTTACPYCGNIHNAICPHIKRIEYVDASQGAIKSVEFFSPAERVGSASEKSIFEHVFGTTTMRNRRG